MIRALIFPPLLAVICALLLLAGPPSFGAEAAMHSPAAATKTPSPHAITFPKCGRAKRVNCVVDGDTFWYLGTKIRIADINTPETSRPACPYEAELGARATVRLIQLLDAGPFTLEQQGRDADRYGRKLRIVTRGGQSLGAVLVTEGLAETWTGRRRDWCGTA